MDDITNAHAFILAIFILISASYKAQPQTEPMRDCLVDIICSSRLLHREIKVPMEPTPLPLNEEILEWHSNIADGLAPRPQNLCSITLNNLKA
jgi:hypothetical protein